MSLDMTKFAGATKQMYPNWKIYELTYANNPLYALMAKDEEFYGEAKKFPLIYANPNNRSATFSTALAGTSDAKVAGFLITRVSDYSLASLSNEVMEASSRDEGAFLSGAKVQLDGALRALARSHAVKMYRSGTGSCGTIKAATTPATTIELANASDVTNFEVGQQLNASATDGGGAARVTVPTITAIDRSTGILTVSPTVNADYAAGDYIYIAGDKNLAMSGLAGWIPQGSGRAAALAASYFGVTRSTDATRLGGVIYDGSAQPIEEALIDGANLLAREGGSPDYCFLNHKNFSDLVKALGSKVQRVQVSAEIKEGGKSMGVVGFQGIEIFYADGSIKVIGDRNCPVNTAYMLQMDTWKLSSLGSAVRLFEGDGLKWLRSPTADAVDIRTFGYLQMACQAPGFNCAIKLA
jgi:hypothetical protein